MIEPFPDWRNDHLQPDFLAFLDQIAITEFVGPQKDLAINPHERLSRFTGIDQRLESERSFL